MGKHSQTSRSLFFAIIGFGCIGLMVLLTSCGKKVPPPKATTANDSLMALFSAPQPIDSPRALPKPTGSTQQNDSTEMISAKKAPVVTTSTPSPDTTTLTDTLPSPLKNSLNDTVKSFAEAVATGAQTICVDSGSVEDKRLDSLALVAASLSYNYQQLVANHTHANLAQQAHQDPARTRRLLNAETQKAPERKEAAIRNNEARKRALKELMEGNQ